MSLRDYFAAKAMQGLMDAAMPMPEIAVAAQPYAFPRDASGASTVDQLDAQAVQKIMHKMPQKHARALGFAYVHPYVHVNKVCRILACNVRDLAELAHEARTMAKNLLRQM